MDGQNSGAIAGKRMVCPVCKKEFGADILYCDVDGNRLAEAPKPVPAPTFTSVARVEPTYHPVQQPSKRKRSAGRVFVGMLAYSAVTIVLLAFVYLGVGLSVMSRQPLALLIVFAVFILILLSLRKSFLRLKDWMNEESE